MIIVHAQQGTPEWLAARAGVVTASDFKLARLAKGAKMTDAQANLAFKKAWERITGKPMEAAGTTWSLWPASPTSTRSRKRSWRWG